MKRKLYMKITPFLLAFGLLFGGHFTDVFEKEHKEVEGLKDNDVTDTIGFDIDKTDEFPMDSVYKERFTKVKRVFSVYNKDVTDETVRTFLTVCQHYDLIQSEELLDLFIGQICVESGAKQFWKDGIVIRSSGNAIGISQIVPTTAFLYMKHYIPEEEKKELKERYGIDMSFVKDHELTTVRVNEDSTFRYVSGVARQKTIDWLSNEKNNLYLWGCIMNKNLSRFDIYSTLVAYNRGPAFLNRVDSPFHHIYVKKIRGVVYSKIHNAQQMAQN